MLTKEKLLKMKPGEKFAMGVCRIEELHSEIIKWIAVRGLGRHDWAIYYLTADKDEEQIRRTGIKSHHEQVIKQLVPCDLEAYKLYRW